MNDFVADDRTDGAIIYDVVLLWIEERGLENAGREVNGVGLRILVGIDGRRRHAPFGAVERRVDFVDPALELEGGGALPVQEITGAGNGQGRVIAPFVRIADFVQRGMEFLLGLFLGLGSHPIRGVNVLGQNVLEVLNQLQHTLFAGRREGSLNIDLPQSFA